MDDNDRIQGSWALVAGQRTGKSFPAEVVQHVHLIFAGNRLTTQNRDRKTEAAFTLDSSKTPHEIDLDMGGSVGKGIYDLAGDTLTIAHGEVGDPRPTDFPQGEANLTVLVLKREPSAS